jgi:hypothetical protein
VKTPLHTNFASSEAPLHWVCKGETGRRCDQTLIALLGYTTKSIELVEYLQVESYFCSGLNVKKKTKPVGLSLLSTREAKAVGVIFLSTLERRGLSGRTIELLY